MTLGKLSNETEKHFVKSKDKKKMAISMRHNGEAKYSEYITKHIVKLLQKERNSFVRAFDWAERMIERQNNAFRARDGNE